ncbi:hypothetical protein, partial [Klebsiella pneumoniae]|uniref:hypothetical protein n=1 Tax=Klebsiella pneumoniae TaxID=573 RepID=UPI001B8D6DA5
YCLKTQPATGETYPKSDLFNKAQIQLHESPFSTLAISTILFESVSNPNGIHFCALRRMYIPR